MNRHNKLRELTGKISVESSDTILSVMKKMDELGMKLLVVNDKSTFKSLVSIGDIQRAIIKGVNLQEKVSGILRDEITICHASQSDEEIKDTMIQHRVEFMPVIDDAGNISRIIFWDEIIPDRRLSGAADMKLPVVIMAGGKGTRLKPLTNIIPKPLIPIGDKPIIEIIFDTFSKYGVTDFFLIVNYKAQMIESFVSGLEKKNYNVQIIREDAEYGTCGSLCMLKGKIKGTFFLTNCDTILDQDLPDVYNFHTENGHELTMIGALKHYSIPYGMIEFDEGGKFHSITEKPELTLAVNSGTYLLESHLFNEVPEMKFFHITELISNIKKRGGSIGVFPVSEKSWLDIGEWTEFNKTQEFLARRRKLERN